MYGSLAIFQKIRGTHPNIDKLQVLVNILINISAMYTFVAFRQLDDPKKMKES